MRVFISICAVILVDVSAASAQASPRSRDVATIHRLDSLWARMYARHDTALARSLYAEDLVFTSANGNQKNREQEIADVRPQDGLLMDYFRTSPSQVRVHDAAAVVTGTAEWRFTMNGDTRDVRRAYTILYSKGGPLGWRILAVHMGASRSAGTAPPMVLFNTAPGTYAIVETRAINAPVELAWSAWSDAEHVRQWWGPHGFTVPIANMQFREGGSSLICMKAPPEHGGQLFCNTWTYLRIVPRERIEFMLHFTDDKGTRIDPATMPGMPAGIPNGVPHRITFTRLDAQRTALTVEEYGYTTSQAQELSRAGLDQVLEKLATYLQTRNRQ